MVDQGDEGYAMSFIWIALLLGLLSWIIMSCMAVDAYYNPDRKVPSC